MVEETLSFLVKFYSAPPPGHMGWGKATMFKNCLRFYVFIVFNVTVAILVPALTFSMVNQNL